ncbi:MAG TPA: hypothetical protein VIO94_16115 [Phenylobacterium sp.]
MTAVKLTPIRENFVCAICQRSIEMRWNCAGPGEIIPPVCRYCEKAYSRGIGRPLVGSFRDRRIITQGFALAEALRDEAARKTWGSRYV